MLGDIWKRKEVDGGAVSDRWHGLRGGDQAMIRKGFEIIRLQADMGNRTGWAKFMTWKYPNVEVKITDPVRFKTVGAVEAAATL